MLQVNKTVNLMLRVQRLLFNESDNLTLSPFALEIITFAIISAIDGKSYEELIQAIYGTDVQFADVVEAIRCYKPVVELVRQTEVHFQSNVYLPEKFDPKPQYVEFVKSFLDTVVKSIKFDERTINDVVAEDMKHATLKEENPFADLLERIFPVDNLCLLTSVAFNGEFSIKPAQQYDAKFRQSNGTLVSTRYWIFRNKLKRHLMKRDNIDYVEIPYLGHESLSLCLILPDLSITMNDLVQKLNYNMLIEMFKETPHTLTEVHLPTFRMQSQFDLTKVMPKFGINKVFEKENANFSRLSTAPSGIHIEALLTNIEANFSKHATGKPGKRSVFVGINSLVFNRPFMFLVTCRHQMETVILFSGIVNTPDKYAPILNRSH